MLSFSYICSSTYVNLYKRNVIIRKIASEAVEGKNCPLVLVCKHRNWGKRKNDVDSTSLYNQLHVYM